VAPRLAGCGELGKPGEVDTAAAPGDSRPEPMLHAFALALQQLADPALRRIWLKSIAATLLLFGLLGAGLWWAADWALAQAGVDEARFAGAEGLRGIAALLGAVLGGWLLWRIVALAVLQFFADEVVAAVEARHYRHHAAAARALGWREELARGLGGAGRALAWNLAAVPVALVLLVTGIGAPLVFYLVNAVLLGRELQDMVWLRHRPTSDAPAPLSGTRRLMLGGVVTALLTVPFVNFLAPFLGAAAATHLIHRKDPSHAA
jgi:CysZ protein